LLSASKATHPGGIDWIINGNAWTRPATPGWEPAEMYWEMVNGRMRFKFYWRGDEAMRLTARTAYRAALEQAAEELGVEARRTRTVLGRTMTGLELSVDGRTELIVNGRVDPERSRALYERG
jgi:hypothetical protein